MSSTFVTHTELIAALGNSTSENFSKAWEGRTGIKEINQEIYKNAFWGGQIDWEYITNNSLLKSATKFDNLVNVLLKKVVENTQIDLSDPEVLVILCSTKGNAEQINVAPYEECTLWYSTNKLKEDFSIKNDVLLISNACISGSAGIATGKRMLDSNKYHTAVVLGADVLSPFIISGFESFMALSDGVCKPYSEERNGINIGEAGAAVVLQKGIESNIILKNGAITNDANHISGPSRDGMGLFLAIDNCLSLEDKPDFISGHGTATPYNDEMESLAIEKAGLSHVPMNSFKSTFGHTLGAAGILESILSIEMMNQNRALSTHNFGTNGVSGKVTIQSKNQQLNINTLLKTAAGFGGSNAALVFQKLV